MKVIGKIDWSFSGGNIPGASRGEEPEFISHDKISILNTSGEKACVELFIFYKNEPPVGPFEISVAPRRLRKVRFNDLVDPTAIRLEKSFGCYIKADKKVVVQFSRMNTASISGSEMCTMAFPVDT